MERMVDKYATLYREMADGAASDGIATQFANIRLADGDELEQLPAEPEEPRAIA